MKNKKITEVLLGESHIHIKRLKPAQNKCIRLFQRLQIFFSAEPLLIEHNASPCKLLQSLVRRAYIPWLVELAKVPSNELCAACPIIVSIADEKAKIETRKRAKELRKIASEKLKNTEVECPNLNEKIRFKKKGIKEFLNQPHKHYGQKNELILNIENVIKNSTYKGVSEYKSNPTEPRVHLLEIEIENEKSWLIIKENKQEGLLFYNISDGEKILNHTKEKDT